jgi:hypothetical protein
VHPSPAPLPWSVPPQWSPTESTAGTDAAKTAAKTDVTAADRTAATETRLAGSTSRGGSMSVPESAKHSAEPVLEYRRLLSKLCGTFVPVLP